MVSKLARSAILLVLPLAACAVPTSEVGSSTAAASEDANVLTLHFTPKVGIDYTSPSSLLLSIQDGDVGHAMVDLKCGATSARPNGFHVFTGQTGGETMTQRVREDGWGFGFAFNTFDGHLQSLDEVQAKLAKAGDNRSFLRVRVSEATCERLVQFYEGYRDHGDGAKYGLLNRPRYHEGSGCVGFAVGFLDVAGLVGDDERTQWRKTVRVSESLIGGPGTDRRVSMYRLLATFSWEDGGPSREATFWEPNILHAWIVATHAHPTDRYRAATEGSIRGVELDARAVPTPTESIFVE